MISDWMIDRWQQSPRKHHIEDDQEKIVLTSQTDAVFVAKGGCNHESSGAQYSAINAVKKRSSSIRSKFDGCIDD
jgi:hypothetical protein